MERTPIARMRLLNDAYAELKSLDPNTKVSKNFIRQLAISGEIPVIRIGKRRLINMDGLFTYLSDSNTAAEPEPEDYGRIRKVL